MTIKTPYLYNHNIMKRHCFLLTMACMATLLLPAQASTININGKECAIDTTANYQLGPGVQHTAFTLTIGSTKHNCYLLEIDLTNPYNAIEEYQSQSRMGATETLASAFQQLDAEQHRTIAGVNSNFWVVSSQNTGTTKGLLGQPFSATARNGVLIGEPSDWNAGHGDRGVVMIDRQKKVYIDNMNFVGTVHIASNDYAIRDVNRTRELPDTNEITLFNHYIGTNPTRSTDGIEIVFSTNQWNINGTMTCTVTAVNNMGGTVLTAGTGVLQGRGTGATALSQLNVGDSFTMSLGVVSTNDENLHPDIMQMVTGNALILKDGVQTARNTNEAYNNQNYPRTVLATNATRNKFWMMVAEKPGMFSADMCAVLQQCGATEAAGLDGGGSAQMCINGTVINTTTDGAPRQVANSIWVLSTAPDDTIVTRIVPSATHFELPFYGTPKVQFLAYNQYDVLLNKDLQGVQLSCDPATGFIDDNGQFVCNGTGDITATYGNAQATIHVTLKEGTDISIRLDSVLISDDTNYAVEVYGIINSEKTPLKPKALNWTTKDASVCSVTQEGVINGVNNGHCMVYGTLGEKTDSILVRVEIPEHKPLAWCTDFTSDKIQITGSNTAWNTQVLLQDDNKSAVTIHFTGGRGANLKIIPNTPLYSLPDYVELRYEPNDFPIQKITATLYANNSSTLYNYSTTSNTPNQANRLVINIDSLLGSPNDIAIYPLRMGYISFLLDVNAEKKDYTMLLDRLYLHYGELSLGFNPATTPDWSIYPNPACDALIIRGAKQGDKAFLYNLQGQVVAQTTLQGNNDILNIQTLSAGQYLLKINNTTTKVIKR